MNIVEYIHELAEQGIQLWATDGRLRYQGTKERITPALLAQLQQHKEALLIWLQQRESAQTLLSYGQQGIWWAYQLMPGSAAYNVFVVMQVEPSLNLVALEQAFEDVLLRHPILRTTYIMRDNVPYGQVQEPSTAKLAVIDAADWSTADLQYQIDTEVDRPFDLASSPLRATVLLHADAQSPMPTVHTQANDHADTLSARHHLLVLVVHHIAIDGPALYVLLDDLCTYYTAHKTGSSYALPALPLQYRDFVRWEADQWQEQVLELINYWHRQLVAPLPRLDLPTDAPRPPMQTYNGNSYDFVLSPTLTQQLKHLAKTHQATLYATLLTSFACLLHRYTNQTDLLVTTPVDRRELAEFARVVGYFSNIVVVRLDLADQPTFAILLARAQATVLAALRHQGYPFALFVRQQCLRDSSRAPFADVSFVFNPPTTPLSKDGLITEILQNKQGGAMTDLTLFMYESSGCLVGLLQYNTDLFQRTTIERMVGHFQTLLAGIVANPDQPIAQLLILTEAERHQLLVEWNDTTTDYPKDKCIHQLFEEQVERAPTAVAVIFEDQQLSYAQLNARANQLAHYLQRLGVGPETLVGIFVERSVEMVVGLLGILKAGGAYVPLDPSYPPERLTFMLQDAGVSILLTQEHLLKQLPATTARLFCLDRDWSQITHTSTAAPASRVTPAHLAYVIYTSGSTGQPKGVEALHRSIMNRCQWMWRQLPFLPGEVACQKTALSFVDSVWEIFGPLVRGVPLLVIADAIVKDPHVLITHLATHQVSRLVLVPSLLKVLLESELNLQGRLPRLTYWACSGEALTADLAQLFQARLPHAYLFNLYGSSEVAGDVTWFDATAECRWQKNTTGIPIGRPIDNTQVYLLDTELQPVPVGVPAQLYVSGHNLARGYYKQPQLTHERFTANPYSSTKLFSTGDLCRWLPDGNIEYLGRIDQQVKIRGFRIELGEIEAVLSQHPAVQEAMVIVHEDTPGEKRLVAYVVNRRKTGDERLAPNGVVERLQSPVTNHHALASTLRSYLQHRLPAYMIPSAFVELDALPLTPNGKIDRKALPLPDRIKQTEEANYVAPRDDVEENLASIWHSLLNLAPISVKDDFFALGGHSLSLAQLSARIRATFRVNIPLSILFQSSTLEQMSIVVLEAMVQQVDSETLFAIAQEL